MQRRLARAVRAPTRIRIDRRIARYVEHDGDAAEACDELHCDRMNVVFARDVADDAVRVRLHCDLLDARTLTRDERDASAARAQLAHQREAEPRRAAGDRHAAIPCTLVRMCLDHRLLSSMGMI